MKRHLISTCLFLVASANVCGAQNGFDSTASTGEFARSSSFDSWGSQSTSTGTNSPAGLAPTTTRLNAPDSVNNAPIPSGSHDLGFPQTGPQSYTGPYKSGPYGGELPQTSTSSVDFDVTSLGSGYRTGFKIEKPTEFQNALKEEGMSTFNDMKGGTDDLDPAF